MCLAKTSSMLREAEISLSIGAIIAVGYDLEHILYRPKSRHCSDARVLTLAKKVIKKGGLYK
jgi:hypothetical protein